MNEENDVNEMRLSDFSVDSLSEEEGTARRLEAVELTLRPGEWVNIVGANGSGKSTLARVIAGLTTEGAAGRVNRGFAGDEPAPYVMQQPDAQLFGETPREEIEFALEWLGVPDSDIEAQTERALERTGLLPFADFGWSSLSGGQRQLAAVAAAAAGRGPLIVFDEATSMLDDASRLRVRQIAEGLHEQGTAIVWVTQQLNELAPEARVITLHDGGIVFDGTGRRFLLGDRSDAAEPTPCERCGLRPPYLAALALALGRSGKLVAPLPVSMDEWRKVMGTICE